VGFLDRFRRGSKERGAKGGAREGGASEGGSPEKDRAVLGLLDEIEAEMKRIGFWTEDPPQFEVRVFTDAPSFELWLQCIFLPHAREAAEIGRYPPRSQVQLMAMRQYDYHSYVPEAQSLLELLGRFDRLIEKP
jgi:uncharacterized protein YqcC (DUF446 family)